MRIAILALLLLAGCAVQQPIKIQFSCISEPQSDRLVTQCMDIDSWRELVKEGEF